MRNQTGDVVNGVIWVQLIDVNQNPMAGYPAEDVWLESHWESFTFAYLGSCPDGTSDAEGLMVWREPLVAGGVALHGLVALVGGQALNLPLLETVRFVSPDISGDMEVNLADLNMFSSDYVATYHERSDLVHDGAIDLADVSLLASHYGHGCP
jgi:hypothetical protein